MQFESKALSAELIFRGSPSGDDGELNPPPVVLSYKAGDPEVSSWRISPNPDFEKGRRTSPTPLGARSEGLQDLLGRASISEEHRMLMNTVIGRISSAESGLYKAARSLLTGFEVREKVYLLIEPHKMRPI